MGGETPENPENNKAKPEESANRRPAEGSERRDLASERANLAVEAAPSTNEANDKRTSSQETLFIGDSIFNGAKGKLGAIDGKNSLVKGATSARTMLPAFQEFLAANKERIAKGEIKQICILAGYNDICNVEGQYPEKSAAEKAEIIFKRLEAIYQLAAIQTPPLKVIACTLTHANFDQAIPRISQWVNWKDKPGGYPGNAERMAETARLLNEKIRGYSGITVVDLAKETTENPEKYPLRDPVHHSKKGAENLAAYVLEQADIKSSTGELSIEVSSELMQEPAGKIHQAMQTKIEELKEKLEADRSKLKTKSSDEVRKNHRILVEKNGEENPEKRITNLKEETARRIATYSKQGSNDWRILDYSSIGGEDHLYGVGLGDILLDQDIQQILVRRNGRIIKGRRGFSSNGRPSFLDENGRYIATLDGDAFKILSNENVPQDDYIKKLDEENTKRGEFERIAASQVGGNARLSDSINWREDAGKKRPTSDDFVVSQLNKHREENDGQEIMAYGKEICAKFGISWNICKEIIMTECAWNHKVQYDGPIASDAAGLGQFLSSTWRRFMKKACGGKILDERWGGPVGSKITDSHKFNPYANLYATIWLLSLTKSSMSSYLEGKPEHEQAFIYYLAHNRGVGGAKNYLKFMDKMKEKGLKNKGEIIAEYNANKAQYNAMLIGAHRRYIRNYGIARWLYVWFKPTKDVALRTLAHNPEALERVQQENPPTQEVAQTNQEGTELAFKTTRKIIDIKKGQDTWVIGASSARGLANNRDATKTGLFGIRGVSAAKNRNLNHFLEKFQSEVWTQTTLRPKRIVITGLSTNGLVPNSRGDRAIARSVEKNVQAYSNMIDFFQSQGIKVEIVTSCPFQPRLKAIMAFNEEMKRRYPGQVIDLFSQVATSDNKIKPEFRIASEAEPLHLNRKGKRIFREMIEGRNLA